MFRWSFWVLVTLVHTHLLFLEGAVADSVGKCRFPRLVEATVDQLQAGLQKGCFDSVDLVNAYVGRIDEVDSTFGTVLEMNPHALNIARQLDRERQQGRIRGPLHGLPVLIKDMIGTNDRMETAAGSWALVGSKVSADSTVVAKLRDNGLIILGKTSLSEWANFRSLNSSNGWSGRGGNTYGAYYPDQDPNGSSSGSAVATDLGLIPFALGTETAGSILLPGDRNNVVGIKPTVGLTSRYMVIPISERQDTIGPLARTVKDAAVLLQAIDGQDPRDNYTLASPFGQSLPDYLAACKLSGLQGKRIGIPRNVIDYLGPAEAPIISAFETAVSVISTAGAVIVDNTNFTAYGTFYDSLNPAIVEAADFTTNIATYLSKLKRNPNNIHSVEDIRDFTQRTPLEDYPSRDTGIWDQVIALGLNNTSPAFWPLYQDTLYFGKEGGLLGALLRNKLDAVILPTVVASGIPAIIGTPVITVPLGAYPDGTPVERNSRGDLVQRAPGIPFGISFLGPKWSEEQLIGMAYAFEQRALVRNKLGRYREACTELEDMI
ncbi:amidase [Aspergillus sclerotioniger CBS 115572]|uniref:Amidase n=1 Tax=Aspergillus sclerotioniger CBS 115572 TaxID=1450535 RepID=A0A317X699_9EURO|nr:amidase [Aspergillus sclerotioniger CBS 115572]PWY94103.1 amidase [Aspergillus sclerotioniger CBS 115572]